MIEQETVVAGNYKYNIHITEKILTDGSKVYNVRVPFNGILPEYRDIIDEPSIRDIIIGAESLIHAGAVAEILEDCSQVDVGRQL